MYVYSRYSYMGHYYFSYRPGYYYRPAFYGWVFNPWVTPVYYRWGLVGRTVVCPVPLLLRTGALLPGSLFMASGLLAGGESAGIV